MDKKIKGSRKDWHHGRKDRVRIFWISVFSRLHLYMAVRLNCCPFASPLPEHFIRQRVHTFFWQRAGEHMLWQRGLAKGL